MRTQARIDPLISLANQKPHTRSSFAGSGRPTMNLIRRLQRLWQLSSPETESISREEYDALLVFLKELDAEMKDMNGRVSDWIGVLIKSELLRRELERTKDAGRDLK